jgi:hypothetical protein
MFKKDQWEKRPWGLQLDCMEITETKLGRFRLWDSSIEGTGDYTIGIYPTLEKAKRCGVALLNEAMREGAERCDHILFGGGLHATT